MSSAVPCLTPVPSGQVDYWDGHALVPEPQEHPEGEQVVVVVQAVNGSQHGGALGGTLEPTLDRLAAPLWMVLPVFLVLRGRFMS